MSGSEYVEKKSSSVPNQTHSSLPPQRSYQPEPIEQETVRIEDQLERASRFGYNGLDVPVNAPATPPPVQRQVNSGGLENNSQPQAVAEVDATSETVEETVSREELVLEEAPPNQESPDTEGEGVAQTVQPEAESGEQQPQKPFLQAQLERASQFGYNGLDVPVNTPGTPSPRVQRKLTLAGLDNEYQPEVIERANPVLNGLNQFKVQRLSEEQGEVGIQKQQLQAPPDDGTIQLNHVVQQSSPQVQHKFIQRDLLDDLLLGASNIYHDISEGLGIESHDEAEIARLKAFAKYGDPSSLSDDELKIKIAQISSWLTKNPQNNPDKELLKSSLTKLESEVKTRAFIATVKKLPGWSKMKGEDQVILENILKGQHNAVSESVRTRLQGMLTDLSSQTDVEQAQALTALISAKESIPGVVNEPVTTTKIKYTLEGPTVEKDYAFKGKTADAEKWIVKFEDGVDVPIVAPKAPEPGYHNHSVQQAADAASYLPKANRSVITTIMLNAVVNPDDAYWATEYNTPNFHSYMTAGKAGVVTIYPDKVSKSLPSDNYMRGTMIHETGHTWSYKTWGTDKSTGKWVDWKKAMDTDKVSVSGYAMASIAEDVAETIQVYSSTKGSPRFAEYRQIVPNRFKMLDAEYK